jgi:hypothetical protein
LRTDVPFPKWSQSFMPANGENEDDLGRIEIMADGGQWIADGIHKETGKPYRWLGGNLAATPREELPYVRRDDLQKLLDEAAHFEHGPLTTRSGRDVGVTLLSFRASCVWQLGYPAASRNDAERAVKNARERCCPQTRTGAIALVDH